MPNTPDTQPLPKLPTGIQDFQRIRKEDYLYVDKTEAIYRLIAAGNPTFLSRPRRFGKTVLVSTMESIFRNQRDLFKDLWIDQSDYEWEEYPVIRLDMAETKSKTTEEFEESLMKMLARIAKFYNCDIPEKKPDYYLTELINALSAKNQVVVLVDEYDKPLLDTIDDLELVKKTRQILKGFYEVLKTQDKEGKLRFIFLTGVTKFSKVSIFSGLNQLSDITLDEEYAGLLGYTKEELEQYFQPWIEKLAEKFDTTPPEIKEKIKTWYNGYQFSQAASIQVYNPFSTLSVLKKQRFDNFWFETGTPTF